LWVRKQKYILKKKSNGVVRARKKKIKQKIGEGGGVFLSSSFMVSKG
jgi:hypothetical protein